MSMPKTKVETTADTACTKCSTAVPRIDFEQVKDTPDTLRHDMTQALSEHGVVVLENVLQSAECDEAMQALLTSLRTLNPALKKTSPQNWSRSELPRGPRAGMFQSLVAHLPAVWKLRTDDRIQAIFRHAYSGTRGEELSRFVCSCDGLTLKPFSAPFHNDDAADWAHVDQVQDSDQAFKCIQGQVVLTNTSAAFRCSPKSHHFLDSLLEADRGKTPAKAKSNFHMFSERGCNAARRLVQEHGGSYQTCVHAPKGSVILWLSSLIHSSRGQDEQALVDPSDRWSQWRGVVYVCYRPRADVDDDHVATLERAFASNRCTSHWGSKIFPKSSGRHRSSPRIQPFVDSPDKVYALDGLRPERTPRVAALLQGTDWPATTKQQQ